MESLSQWKFREATEEETPLTTDGTMGARVHFSNIVDGWQSYSQEYTNE